MRAAQNLDPVGEEVVAAGGGGEGGIDAVGVVRDAGLRAEIVGVAADAAQEDAFVAGAVGEARRHVGQVGDCVDAQFIAQFGCDGGDCDGDVLHRLFAFVRRNHDDVPAGLAVLSGRLGGLRAGNRLNGLLGERGHGDPKRQQAHQ